MRKNKSFHVFVIYILLSISELKFLHSLGADITHNGNFKIIFFLFIKFTTAFCMIDVNIYSSPFVKESIASDADTKSNHKAKVSFKNRNI